MAAGVDGLGGGAEVGWVAEWERELVRKAKADEQGRNHFRDQSVK